MTYNVFGATLNLAQSINLGQLPKSANTSLVNPDFFKN